MKPSDCLFYGQENNNLKNLNWTAPVGKIVKLIQKQRKVTVFKN